MFTVQINKAIPFQFDVYDTDGYTAQSGLTSGDFSIELWKDNVKQAADVINTLITSAISELSSGSGTYGSTITFNDVAHWRLVVRFPTDKEIYEAFYDVVLYPQGAAPLGNVD